MDAVTFTLTSGLLLLLLWIPGVTSGSYCYSLLSTYSTYCAYGCCGYYSSDLCCGFPASTGLIVGSIFGSLVGLGILICLIVICVSFCCKTTRVVNPQPVMYTGGVVSVVSTSNAAPGPSGAVYPNQPYGMQGPPPYKQGAPGQGPPPYMSHPPPQAPPPYMYNPPPQAPPANTSDPAYPPPGPANYPPPPATPSPFAAAAANS